jgi:hypothetical protein
MVILLGESGGDTFAWYYLATASGAGATVAEFIITTWTSKYNSSIFLFHDYTLF